MPTFESHDFSTPQPYGKARYPQPIDKLNDFVQLEQDYLVDYPKYKNKPLPGTPHPTLPDFYLLKETKPVDFGVHLSSITRLYSPIPPSWTQPISYNYSAPGIATVTSQTNTINLSKKISLPSIASKNLQDHYWYYNGVNSYTPTYDTVTSDVVVSKRKPRTKQVMSFVQYDYFALFLSTDIKAFSSIPLFNPLVILDADGEEVDTVSNLTTPTKAEYEAWIAAGKMICVEQSELEEWQSSRVIYERRTRYVRAA